MSTIPARKRATGRIGTEPSNDGASSRQRTTQTVDRAMTVLSCFSLERPELSLTEIAQFLELHVSTVHRLLKTMEAGGYVERAPRSGHYRLGLRIIELAGIALNQSELRRHGMAELDHLRDLLNLNANLAVLDRGDVFHLAYAVRADTPRFYTTLGRRAVAHCTALGKVLLAAQPRSIVHADIQERGWRPYTVHSIQDLESLDRCLDEVAAQGYAIDREERSIGTWCVAAPVRDYTRRVVAAMSVTGPTRQVEGEALSTIIAAVREHADRLSMKLGYQFR
jgi:IclR family KDG regulon transcriptional repressor